jgi:hypothetical protein
VACFDRDSTSSSTFPQAAKFDLLSKLRSEEVGICAANLPQKQAARSPDRFF